MDVTGFTASQAHLHKPTGLANTLIQLTSSLFVAMGIRVFALGQTVRAPLALRLACLLWLAGVLAALLAACSGRV